MKFVLAILLSVIALNVNASSNRISLLKNTIASNDAFKSFLQPKSRSITVRPQIPQELIQQQQLLQAQLLQQQQRRQAKPQIPQELIQQQQLLQQQQQQQQRRQAKPQIPQELIQQQQLLQQQLMQQQFSKQQQFFRPQQSTQIVNPCVGKVENDKFANRIDPSQFFVCLDNGSFHTMNCPAGLIFNEATDKCETSLRTPAGCASLPCQNGGVCRDLQFSQFKCECKMGFNGLLCEKQDVCAGHSCGPNGVCIPLAPGSPLKSFCLCNKGQTFGTDCSARTEQNPCVPNDAELQNFPVRANSAIFVHCEGHIPHLKFCMSPLLYNHQMQRCDWATF